MDYPVSEALKELLRRDGMDEAKRQLGRVEMEKAGRSHNGAAPQVTLDSREEIGGHPEDKPSPARQNRPVLRVVNGKGWRTRPQSERLPPLGVRQPLTLVWSR